MMKGNFPYKFRTEHEELKAGLKSYVKSEPFLKGTGSTSQDAATSRRIESVDALTWTADGQRLALCAKDGSVRVYRGEEARSGVEEFTMAGSWTHTEAHPSNGELLTCVGWDGKIRLLDLRGGYSECKGEEKIFASSFSCDGNAISVHTRSDTVHVFDVRNLSAPTNSSTTLKHEVHATVWTASNQIWTAMGNGELAIIDMAHSDSPDVITAHQGAVMALARNLSGTAVVSVGGDGLVGIWDVDKKFCKNTIAEAQSAVTTVDVSGCGRLAAFGCGKDGENVLYVAGVNTAVVYANVDVSGPVMKVAFHPQKTAVAYAVHQPQSDASIIQLVNFD